MSSPADTIIRASTSAILDRCTRLSRLSEDPHRLTRTFLSPPMREVHREVGRWMADAGMTVRIDGIGNIVGRREGATAGAPTLLIGSHLDTVPDAGKFDGILGVMLGIAAVEVIAGLNRQIAMPIEVVGFSEEEGVRFAAPYLGSQAFTGQLGAGALQIRDRAGIGVLQAAESFGLDLTRITFDSAHYAAYLEAHIEQGPVLEFTGRPLGVVSAIAGQSRRRVRFVGRAAHAGTTPMHVRRDALAAAAAWIGQVEAIASAHVGGVATVGQVAVAPGASNVVPGEVTPSLDVRHAADATRHELLEKILSAGASVAAARAVTFDVLDGSDHATTPMDERLTGLLRAAAGADAPVLPSGAGHDAAVLAAVMPTCMLFVRSPGGVSHHPDEHVYAADVERALRAVVRFVENFNHGGAT